nr:hypothetical protein [Cronobacter dublinensis]
MQLIKCRLFSDTPVRLVIPRKAQFAAFAFYPLTGECPFLPQYPFTVAAAGHLVNNRDVRSIYRCNSLFFVLLFIATNAVARCSGNPMDFLASTA